MVSELLLNAGNLGLTFFLALEVAQIKRSLQMADSIEVRPPAIIELARGWKA